MCECLSVILELYISLIKKERSLSLYSLLTLWYESVFRKHLSASKFQLSTSIIPLWWGSRFLWFSEKRWWLYETYESEILTPYFLQHLLIMSSMGQITSQSRGTDFLILMQCVEPHCWWYIYLNICTYSQYFSQRTHIPAFPSAITGPVSQNLPLFPHSRSDVAILYNDRSVLENHHVSAAYRLMQEEEMNILANLNKDDWR